MRPFPGLVARLLPLAWIAAAGGCASVRVSTEVDPSASFAAYRSFDWVSPEDSSEDPKFPGFRHTGRQAIAEHLTAKGYLPVKAGAPPDFLVQFFAFVEHEEETVLIEEGEVHQVGTPVPSLPPERSRSPSAPRPDPPSIDSSAEGVAIDDLEVDDLEIGDLVLEILDARTRKVVWRGTGRGIADVTAPQAELSRALERVLARFPDAAGA